MHSLFADGDDVCLIFDMVTAGAGTRPIAEWYFVWDGRIASLRVIFDARPFAGWTRGRVRRPDGRAREAASSGRRTRRPRGVK